MSHTHSTENYNLPQFIGTDIPDWLTDANKGYFDIDAGMQANKVSANTANEKADNNTTSIQLLNERVDNISNELGNADTNISNLEQTVELHTTHLNEIDTTNAKQTQDIEELRTTQSEQGHDISEMLVELNDLSEVSNQVNVISATVTDNTSRIDALQRNTESASRRIEEMTVDISTLKDNEFTERSAVATVTPVGGGQFTVDSCLLSVVERGDGTVMGWFIRDLKLSRLTAVAGGQSYSLKMALPPELRWDQYLSSGAAQAVGTHPYEHINFPAILGLWISIGELTEQERLLCMWTPNYWTGEVSVSVKQNIII